MTVNLLIADLNKLADPIRATHSLRFFKTGPGEYGEGDKFLGLSVPEQRQIAKKYCRTISLKDTLKLLKNEHHEARFVALAILVHKFEKGTKEEQKEIYHAYLAHTAFVSNWDLVDSSAHKIVGRHLLDKPRHPLYNLARSPLLWDRRIAIISTFAFIAAGEYDDSLNLAKALLRDKEDLIHKAVGWVLREVGKRKANLLTDFLDEYAPVMPRTMLRYSLEKLSSQKRAHYLHLKLRAKINP